MRLNHPLSLLFVAMLAWLGSLSAVVAQETLRVFAAASMKTALDQIAGRYEQAKGIKVTVAYGASSSLARQIEQGAPADLFISADEDWMDYVEARQLLLPQTRRPLVGNRLVMIAPVDTPLSLSLAPTLDLAGLLGPQGRIAIGDPRAVPAGKYARSALQSLNLWAQVEHRLAPAENVRVALGMVAHGETPLGIVYASDQLAEPRTRVVAAFPETTHAPILYPVAALGTGQRALAVAFIDYLRAREAQALLASSGFVILPQNRNGM